MKKILFLIPLLFLSLFVRGQNSEAQIKAFIDIARTGPPSTVKIGNALDALNYGKQGFLLPYIASGTNTYVLTGPTTISGSYVSGTVIAVTFTNANSSTTLSLNINSVGALAIKDNAGADLAIGDIEAGGTYWLKHNGTHLRIIGATGGGGAGLVDGDYGDITVGGSGTTMTINSGAMTATEVVNTPTGNIAATNVQAALNELDAEKISSTGATGTGTTIVFTEDKRYNTEASPGTGNITIDGTGLKILTCVIMVHNDASEPSYGTGTKVIAGEYVPAVNNYIMYLATESGVFLVTISQEI